MYVYVSEELRLVHHRLSCRIFMQNYQVGKEPDYLRISVFSRTSKGNIIYTRQNKKNSCLWSLLAPVSILSLVYILDFLKDFCFTFFIQKVLYKKVCQPIDFLTYLRFWRGKSKNNILFLFLLIFSLTSKIINTGTCFALLLKLCVV